MKKESIKPNNEPKTLLDFIIYGGENIIKEYHKKYHFLPFIGKLDGYNKILEMTIVHITEGFIDLETNRENMLTRLRVLKQKIIAFKEEITLENQILNTDVK